MPDALEYRPMLTGPNLTGDIILHLRSRCNLGVSVIITEKPISFLSSLRKQWIRYERQLQRDRAKTMNPEKIVAFTTTLQAMRNVRFSASGQWGDADIYVVAPNFTPFGVLAKTVYICAPLAPEQRLVIRQSLQDDAVVINYAALPASRQ